MRKPPVGLSAMLLGLGLLALMGIAFSVGRFALGPADVLRLVLAALSGTAHDLPPATETLFWQVRAPRVLAAVLVGCALAAAGSGLQAVFRNPLASPDLLGVSAGAALGAVTGIYLGWPVVLVQLAAFGGGLIAVSMVYLIARQLPLADRTLSLVLSGIAVGSMLGAALALIKTLADPYTQLPAITFWLMGSLAAIAPRDMLLLAVGVGVGLLPLVLMRWQADALAVSEDEMHSLGIDVRRLRAALIVGATLTAAVTVAAVGVVGWIGLVVPHGARLLVGARFSRLLPVSMLMGAALMLLIDTVSRAIAPVEIPPGVLTAVLGGPVLLVLMMRAGRR